MSDSTFQTRRSLVLVSVMLAMFMIAIEATIVATAMPEIVGRLGGFSLYSWVFAGFLLTQTATTVLFGKLADLYGRRPVMICGIVIFLIGSTLCGFATTMISLIAFRLLQGLGAGAMQPVAMTIVADLYSPEERAGIQGYLSSVWGISAVIGPLVGGIIVEKLSWPWVFWINIPFGIATVFMLLKCLHEGVERKKHSLDILGSALFAIGISCLLVALTEIGQEGANPVVIWITLAAFLVCIPAFFWQERRAQEPMLDLSLWRDKLISSSNATSLVAGMALTGVTSYLAVYVQGVMGYSATIAGLTLTMTAVGWPIAAFLARKLYSRMAMQTTLRVGSGLVVVGAAVLPFLTPGTSPIVAGLGSLVIGFGMGFLIVTCIIMIQGSVSWQQRGSATAANVFSRTLGQTLGAVVLGSVLNYGLHNYSKSAPVDTESVRKLLEAGSSLPNKELVAKALAHGLTLAFWCVLAFAVISMLLAFLIPNRNMEDLVGGAKG